MITADEARGEPVPYTEADVDRMIRAMVDYGKAYRVSATEKPCATRFFLSRWAVELTSLCEAHGFDVKIEGDEVRVSWALPEGK